MKILIVSVFFPPQNAIASLRPYSWAKYWSRAGHEVTVLTIPKKPAPSDSPLPCEGFAVLEVPIPGIGLIRRFFGNGAPANGTVAALQDGASPHRKSLGPRVRRFITRLQHRYGIFYSVRMPDILDFWAIAAYQTIKNDQWDAVVSTAWPYSVHWPAYWLKHSGRVKRWVADWRDLWTDNHMYPGLPLIRSVERWVERRFCYTADIITTVSEPLAAVLRSKYGDKVAVIYNGFDPEDYASLPNEKAFPNDGVFRIVYTGSIYKGKRDPSPLFAAVEQMALEGKLMPEQLQILFCGNRADVSDLAATHGVSAYVHYLGFLPRPKALHIQRDADALLFLEFGSETVKGILTGKLFEYLFAGPPILAVGIGSDSSVGELLQHTGKGYICGQDSGLVMQNISLLMSMMRSVGIEVNPAGSIRESSFIEQFSRAEQAETMLSLVDGIGN